MKVIDKTHKPKTCFKLWLCRCDCGNYTEVTSGNLTRKKPTKSCGCLKQDLFKNLITKHGATDTDTYKTWTWMRSRCNNPNNRAYKNYGGRGIKVCKRWDDFKNFLEDMGEKPNGFSIDRIDVNKGYNKNNCQWTPMRNQVNNRRKTVFLTYKGETKALGVWAKEFGIRTNSLHSRINNGWSVERALEEPVRKRVIKNAR